MAALAQTGIYPTLIVIFGTGNGGILLVAKHQRLGRTKKLLKIYPKRHNRLPIPRHRVMAP